MTFTETLLEGVLVVGLEKHTDDRGFFARIWCPKEFAARGLNPDIAQVSLSYNAVAGTLRGMHYQAAPHAEAKLVRVTAGAIWDVALDLRPESKTFAQWFGTELTAENRRMLYIPEGCAHGFITLAENTEVAYHISAAYEPLAGRGVRWDDPAFDIRWPRSVTVIGPKDRAWPAYSALGKGGVDCVESMDG
jgi:dTDP-4-dehydrorhamnose 3,5-epimerase